MTYKYINIKIRNTESSKYWQEFEKWELLFPGGNVKWCTYFGKTIMTVPQEIKNKTTIWDYLVFTQKN